MRLILINRCKNPTKRETRNKTTLRVGIPHVGSDSIATITAKKYNSEVTHPKRADSRGREQEVSRRSQHAPKSRTPSKSPPLKVWDPLQAEQDKVVRKKEREDVYHSHLSSEEPLLLIKKREITTKYIRPDEEIVESSPTRIIKKSEKSKCINVDYETAKRKMEELKRTE